MDVASDAAEDFTVDAFHRGRFFLVQPARKGHRAGTDALMLAASVPSDFAGRLADLGAGAGAAGLAVAARCPQAQVKLVERAPEMVDYARRSLALGENAHLAQRCEVVEADIRLGDHERRRLFADSSFDWAIMNPPFNNAQDRASPDELRRQAHVMEDERVFDDWMAMAGSIVRPGGGVAAIARPHSLAAILAAMRPFFGGVEIRALHPRAQKPATRVIVRARRGAWPGLSLLPPLILHEQGSNGFSADADAINSGLGSLFGD